MAKRKGDRIGEPKFDEQRNRWRVLITVITEGKSDREYQQFATEKDAWEFRDAWLANRDILSARSVSDAIEAYRRHLDTRVAANDMKRRSADTTIYHVEEFFPNDDRALAALTPADGKAAYDAVRHATKPGKDGIPKPRFAASSHRNMLAEAKTFMHWCRKQGWIRENPLEEVEGEGKRKKGKRQPTFDEARRWYGLAFRLAQRGEHGPAAALLTVVFGMRASEAGARMGRDVDDDGKKLRTESKTEAGWRIFEVPEPMRPILLRFKRARGAEEYIFGRNGKKPMSRYTVLRWVKTLCRRTGIPEYTAHGMRGFHATAAESAGATAAMIIQQMGHTSFSVTKGHYIAPGTIEQTRTKRTFAVISGDRRGPKRADEFPKEDTTRKIR